MFQETIITPQSKPYSLLHGLGNRPVCNGASLISGYMIGIYKITSPSGRVYIGQSVGITKRFNKYKNLDCICQPRLHASFTKYGHESHVFEILETCEPDQLNNRERHYQDLYNVLGPNGLNCRITGTNDRSGYMPDTKRRGQKRTPEQCKRMSDAQRGIPRPNRRGIPVSEEARHKMRLAKLGKKLTEAHKLHLSGNNQSESTILKRSLSLKGRVVSRESREKISRSNMGKKMSDEAKNNMRIAAKKRGIPDETRRKLKESNSKIILNIETGIYYYGYRDAARSIKMHYSPLMKRLKGKHKNNTNLILT